MNDMITVDIGNSNITIGLFQGEDLCFTRRLMTHGSWDENSLTMAVRDSLFHQDIVQEAAAYDLEEDDSIETGFTDTREAITSIQACSIITSVVPELTSLMKESLQEITGNTPLVLSPDLETGIDTSLYQGGTLGSDRLVDMAAASQLADGPIMTVDLGTCTTINVIDAKRTFLGGMILPGIQLELRALADGTAQLPSLMPEPVTELLGRNTRDNMLSGTIACTGLEIQAIADRVERDLDLEKGSLQVILTGGLSQLVLPWIHGPVTYEPDLMLHGLRSILLQNQK